MKDVQNNIELGDINSKCSSKHFDYTKIRDEIDAKGYQNPETDKGDSRYREVWQYITSNYLEMKIVNIKEVVYNLASHDDEHFQYLQCRSDSEDNGAVDDLCETFFTKGEKLERLPIVFNMEQKFYVSVGNHRCRAILKGFEQYGDSNFRGHAILIDPEDKLSILEKKEHGLNIAVKSNRQTKDQTRPETATDIGHQLKIAFKILEEKHSVYKNYSPEQKREWAQIWCKTAKPYSSARVIATAINKFESKEHGQSIPFPEIEDVEPIWKQYWKNSTFKLKNTEDLIQEKSATHYGNFQKRVMTSFLNRKHFTSSNPRMEMCIRAGETLEKIVESESYIIAQRDLFRKQMIEWNKNVNVKCAGFPMIQRMLFVKQTNIGYHEAWEWDPTAGEDEQGDFILKTQNNKEAHKNLKDRFPEYFEE